jgi:arylsulfatase B
MDPISTAADEGTPLLPQVTVVVQEENQNNDQKRRSFLLRTVSFVAVACVVSLLVVASHNTWGRKAMGMDFHKKSSSKSSSKDSKDDSKDDSKSTLKKSSKSSQSEFPNIVFVLADDLGFSQLGYDKGDDGYFDFDLAWATPHLTALAKKGIVMRNYYSQEVCTPARASLLTGRYPLSMGMQFGVVDTRTPWGMPLGEQTLADVLSENGYVTRGLGKWHLGHFSPKFLPTARGFDSFIGYMNGDNYYPLETHFVDFLEMDRDCYKPYMESDIHNYSTHFYRTKAIDIIQSHDQSTPLFLYLPFQAVHDPFADIIANRDNAKNFVADEVKTQVRKNVVGSKRESYAYALSLLDGAVGAVVDALEDTGMMDNTYLIFASDNGGCYSAGGKSGPFRGTKGTIFEGGTKVDAFVYSPLLKSKLQGSSFYGLMHVSDWFPTIMDLAGIKYEEREGFALDGVSQVDAWSSGESVRTEMLYNSVYNVKNKAFEYWTNGWFAVRNEQYKLAHFFNSSYYAQWYNFDMELNDDDEPNVSECSATSGYAFDGEFQYALYDLKNDPYEKNNLYDDTSKSITKVKAELYALIDKYQAKSTEDVIKAVKPSKKASVFWQNAGGYIVPFSNVEDAENFQGVSYAKSFPKLCMR